MVFTQNYIFEKMLMARETHPPFMANGIKISILWNPSLVTFALGVATPLPTTI